MTVVKSKEIVFCMPVCFSKKKTKKNNNNNNKEKKNKKTKQNKKQTNKQTKKKKKSKKEKKKNKKKHFSNYINIKIEMNLCSGKTIKLKDLFPIERDCGLNAQLYKPEYSNFFYSIIKVSVSSGDLFRTIS